MTKFVLPLEVIGLLLTAALIGAVIIAMHEKEEDRSEMTSAASAIFFSPRCSSPSAWRAR